MIGYLGLGSNVGDRELNLRAAVDGLRSEGIEVEAISSIYETEPVGEVTEQRDFLNAAVRIRTAFGPNEVLAACKRIEADLGREPGGTRHGPRPIDVDLLLLGELVVEDEEVEIAGTLHRLTLPHRDLKNRRFVLVPLLELDPGLALPDGTALADCLADLGAGDEQRVEPTDTEI